MLPGAPQDVHCLTIFVFVQIEPPPQAIVTVYVLHPPGNGAVQLDVFSLQPAANKGTQVSAELPTTAHCSVRIQHPFDGAVVGGNSVTTVPVSAVMLRGALSVQVVAWSIHPDARNPAHRSSMTSFRITQDLVQPATEIEPVCAPGAPQTNTIVCPTGTDCVPDPH